MQSSIYDFLLEHKKWNIEDCWNGKDVLKSKTVEEFWNSYGRDRLIVAKVFYKNSYGEMVEGHIGLGHVQEFFKELLKEEILPEHLRNEIVLCLAFK